MSDIKVGDTIKVTGKFFADSFPLEYPVVSVPDAISRYLIMEHNGDQYGFNLDEVEKVEPELKYKFAVGDRVTIDSSDTDTHTTGVIERVDLDDPGLPYSVILEGQSYGDWFTFSEVREYVEIERPDYTELVAEADNIIGLFEGSPLADIVTRLRDALVEESYREGK